MKPLAYFVAGNLWGLVAFALAVGRKVERSSPEFDSFAGYGWLDANTYSLLTGLAAVITGVFVWLSLRKEPGGAPAWKPEPKP